MNEWYRQPVMWLAVALPAAAVVAGIGLAIAAHSDLHASPDRVTRVAQIQTTDAARDQHALALDLLAQVEIQGDAITVTAHDLPNASALVLNLIHATDADRDQHLALANCGVARYCATSRIAPARMHLDLHDRANTWRIVGQWQGDAGVVILQPAWSRGP